MYCGFPVSHSTSAPYSFTDLTPMLIYKCTHNLIKSQRRYKNHMTIWRLTCHANSSCHRFVINDLYCFCKDSKRHGVALQSESIAELFSLRPAPREPRPLALLVPASAKEMTKSADVRERLHFWCVCSFTVPRLQLSELQQKHLKYDYFDVIFHVLRNIH